MFEKKDNETIDPILDLGLEKLDKCSLDIISKMLNQRFLECWRFTKHANSCSSSVMGVTTTTAIYNQNYIILKQLLNLQEQNQQIIEQNSKVIELLTTLVDK